MLLPVDASAAYGPAATVRNARSCALVSPPVGPVAATAATLAVTESVRSASYTESVPAAASPAAASSSVAADTSEAEAKISGASLVPVMVIVTVWVSSPGAPPLLSVAVR